MENRIIIDYSNIFEYSKDTIEYMFVDRAEVIPGKEAWGIKLSSHQDWYYKIHFPGNPIMPGVFIMESLMTTGAFIINTMEGKKEVQFLFDSCKEVKIYKSVRPGDTINSHVKLVKYRLGVASFEAEAFVENNLICKMSFRLIAPSELLVH